MCEVEADALRNLFSAMGRTHPDYLEGGGKEKVLSNLARPMGAFEKWIAGKEYLVGERFTGEGGSAPDLFRGRVQPYFHLCLRIAFLFLISYFIQWRT